MLTALEQAARRESNAPRGSVGANFCQLALMPARMPALHYLGPRKQQRKRLQQPEHFRYED